MARSDPMAEASSPDMRARRRPGTAIAAMMPMIATTTSSSMRVKPLESRILKSCCLMLQQQCQRRLTAELRREVLCIVIVPVRGGKPNAGQDHRADNNWLSRATGKCQRLVFRLLGHAPRDN